MKDKNTGWVKEKHFHPSYETFEIWRFKMTKRTFFKTMALAGFQAAIMLSMCIGLSACKKIDTEIKGENFSEYSFSDFKKALSEEKIDSVDIYYLSYSKQFNRPLRKEDFIKGFYDYKTSLNTELVFDFKKIIDAFLNCPFEASDRDRNEVIESRLACVFYNNGDRKSIKMFFRYDLSEVEINNKRYRITENVLYSILTHLPMKAYKDVDEFYHKDLKATE